MVCLLISNLVRGSPSNDDLLLSLSVLLEATGATDNNNDDGNGNNNN